MDLPPGSFAKDVPLIAEAPGACGQCGAPLCLRKQVINLALGNVESMSCLVCLGKESAQNAPQILEGLLGYIERRDCFYKQWSRYLNVKYCPDQAGCFPDICFKLTS